MGDLEIYRYGIREENVPYPTADPATGLPMVVDVDVVVWLEPNTGASVDAIDIEIISAMTPDGTKYVRFTADMRCTDTTVTTLVASVTDDKETLTFVKRPSAYLPGPGAPGRSR